MIVIIENSTVFVYLDRSGQVFQNLEVPNIRKEGGTVDVYEVISLFL